MLSEQKPTELESQAEEQIEPSRAKTEEVEAHMQSQLVELETLENDSKVIPFLQGDIIAEEDREEGSVSFKILLLYIKLIGGLPIFLLALLFFLAYATMELFLTTYYFGYRTKMGEEIIKDDLIFMSIYVLLVAFTLFLMFFKYQIIFVRNIILSRFVNLEMTINVIHASVSNFFDTVPLGRILNRFLKDTRILDDILPWKITYFLTTM